jgi:hypothetical protein
MRWGYTGRWATLCGADICASDVYSAVCLLPAAQLRVCWQGYYPPVETKRYEGGYTPKGDAARAAGQLSASCIAAVVMKPYPSTAASPLRSHRSLPPPPPPPPTPTAPPSIPIVAHTPTTAATPLSPLPMGLLTPAVAPPTEAVAAEAEAAAAEAVEGDGSAAGKTPPITYTV